MQETYQFKDGRLTLQDPDLGIDIDDVFDPLKFPKDLAKTSHLILKKSAQGSVLRAFFEIEGHFEGEYILCLLYTSPSPRDLSTSRMPSSA